MKQKFFSLMVAACAACLSFTGLTACGGGGGGAGEANPGVMTMAEFQKGKKEFRVLGGMPMTITPVQEADGSQGTGDPNTVYVDGIVTMEDVTYNAVLIYSTDEKDHEDGQPRLGKLEMSMKSVAALTDPSLLTSLGNPHEQLVGEAIKMEFDFATHVAKMESPAAGENTVNYPSGQLYLIISGWIVSSAEAQFYVPKK